MKRPILLKALLSFAYCSPLFPKTAMKIEAFKASSHMSIVVLLLPQANTDFFENLLKKCSQVKTLHAKFQPRENFYGRVLNPWK